MQCLQELWLVFRSDGDCGDKRLLPTPKSDKVLENLEKFMTKWQQNDYDKATLFKPETITVLQRLKKHIQLGCLCDIPPGGGTNQDERLHQHLGNYFNRNKIGVLLAYALLTVILHSHSTSTKRNGKLVSRPISASPFRASTAQVKPIGIVPKQQSSKLDVDHWETDTSERIVDYGLGIPIYHTQYRK